MYPPARTNSLALRSRAFVVALFASCAPAAADQILEVQGTSLTNYLPSSVTNVQGVRPQHQQRGVNVDGSVRAPAALAWAFAGNPFGEEWDDHLQMGDLRLDIGTYAPTEIDLALPAPGFSWTVGRSYNARQLLGGSHHNSNGYQGKNWFQLSQPVVLLYDADGLPATKQANDVLYIVYGADRYIEFKRTADSGNEFKGKNGAAGVVQLTTGSPDTYTYTDQQGNQTLFFGFNTSANATDGQLWKMTDPAGNTAYVGDASSASTAITNGYASGRITTAYDTAGRRYTYTYSSGTIGGATRLTQVKTEVDSGGVWLEVDKVEYAYYENDADSHGRAGDLKLVTITTPLTDAGVNRVEKTYYRYYDQAWADSDGRRGQDHQIKMVVDAEGYRKYDFGLDASLDDDTLTASDVDLAGYSAAYFEYASSTDRRLSSVFLNGECGCSGGANGSYAFTYSEAASYSTYIGNTSYDTTGNPAVAVWATRTVIEPPTGAAWVTQYFDEGGQPLSRVVTDGAPSSPTKTWPTHILRDETGQVIKRHWPRNITTYSHANVTFTASSSEGLVRTYGRVASGDMKGFLDTVTFQTGDPGSPTQYYEQKLEYSSATYTPGSTSSVVRPLVAADRLYKVETTSENTTGEFDKTEYVYTMHTGGAGVLVPKVIQIKHPVVSTAKNGSGVQASEYAYHRKDGTRAFHRTALGAFLYTQHTNDQVVKWIEDCKTDHGSDYAAGDDPGSNFNISETPDGSRVVTSSTYDAQGREETTTLADGRVTRQYYSQLADGRGVEMAIPRVTSGPRYFGPVSYGVLNLANGMDVEATVALDSAGITTALTSWITETSSDPIVAKGVGSLERMAVSVYSNTGHRVNERRIYHAIPMSGAGTDKTHYDRTLYSYDDAGRQTHVNDPSRTILETKHDVRGLPIERWIDSDDAARARDPELIWTGGYDGGVSQTQGTGADGGDGGGTGDGQATSSDCYEIVELLTDFNNKVYRDLRGRGVYLNATTAPHTVSKIDNRGREIAVARYTASITAPAPDPTATTALTRRTLGETFYDERGRVWKKTRHKISQSDGSKQDTLDELFWYDDEGRVIKIDGDQLVKIRYDRLGRETHRFILAKDNDAALTYSDIYDAATLKTKVDGDIVLEEHQIVYDNNTGEVLIEATINRLHDDLANGTTGELDTNGDGDLLKYTPANLLGRIQVEARWYDDWNRLVTRAEYGTNGGSTFDYNVTSEPTASAADRLVTKYRYDGVGETDQITDAKAIKTVYAFDKAGRSIGAIENFVDGTPGPTDEDRTTEYVYEYPTGTPAPAGLVHKLVAKRGSGEDQTTVYTYGVAKTESDINAGHLLRTVQYPDSAGGTDLLTYAYDKGLLVKSATDQGGNIIAVTYDESRRKTQRQISAGTGFDGAVSQILTTYNTGLGQIETVKQLNTSSVVLDAVKFTFEGWGQIETFEQDPDSDFGGGGRAAYQVSYTYGKSTAGRNVVQRTNMALPGALSVDYSYLGTSNQLDSDASRVSRLSLVSGMSTTPVALYKYLGPDWIVETDYPDPDVFARKFGATSGSYPHLDRFNRPIKDTWSKDLATDVNFYDVDISYDYNSNITRIEDNIQTAGAGGTGNGLFDGSYDLDDLNRVTRADEGNWNGTTINVRARDELWTLDPTGNATVHILDLNGNGVFTDAGDLNENNPATGVSPRFNKANELTSRDVDNNGSANHTLSYDAVGNLTDDGVKFEYTYDARGQLREVRDTSGAHNLGVEYRYNGLGYMIGRHHDADADGDVDTNDPWYYFVYDEYWRVVGTFRGSDTNPKERFVHHNGGSGMLEWNSSGSYIDTVVLRQRDMTNGWTGAADGTLEETVYYCQNWRADVAAVISSAGATVEWVKYSTYGVPFGLPQGDTDSDGDVDTSDVNNWGGMYDVREDTNLDGVVNITDYLNINALSGTVLGRNTLSRADVASKLGFAGYGWDSQTTYYHVRSRVYLPALARWLTRDPAHYRYGLNLYEYLDSEPLIWVDPFGLGPTTTRPKDLPRGPNTAPWTLEEGDTGDDLIRKQKPHILDPGPIVVDKPNFRYQDDLKKTNHDFGPKVDMAANLCEVYVQTCMIGGICGPRIRLSPGGGGGGGGPPLRKNPDGSPKEPGQQYEEILKKRQQNPRKIESTEKSKQRDKRELNPNPGPQPLPPVPPDGGK